MKLLRPLLLSFALLAFAGCDRTVGSSSETPATGAVDFSLPAALRTQVAGSADSLRVELRQGTVLKSRSVAFDSGVRVEGLDAGLWTLSVGLYKAGGALTYFGEDSVRILPGQVAKAVVTLLPATGSVDIVIRLEEKPTDPSPLRGHWFLLRVDAFVVSGKSIPLYLGDSGNVSGSDGCNGISGSYQATAVSIRFGSDFLSTDMYCGIYETMPSVTRHLVRARSWSISDSDLILKDSTGGFLLRYGRTPPVVPPPPSDWIRLDSIAGDTAGHVLVGVRLDTAIASDSGVELSVVLPHPGLTLQLFSLPAFPRGVDTLADPAVGLKLVAPPMTPSRLLVAGENLHPELSFIQVLTPVQVFVPWSALPAYVQFEDLPGRSITLLRPGYGLL